MKRYRSVNQFKTSMKLPYWIFFIEEIRSSFSSNSSRKSYVNVRKCTIYFIPLRFVSISQYLFKTSKSLISNMKRKVYLLSIIAAFFIPQLIFAQQADNKPYYHRRGGPDFTGINPSTDLIPNSSGQSGTGANMDVVYHRINWNVDPRTGKVITGTVVTYFKTLVANVSALTFDLNSASFPAASVTETYHSLACTDASSANKLTITLPSTIALAGTLDSVVINYTGTPPAVNMLAQGYQAGSSGINRYITTLSESYEDRDWWPCKADMQDKIDSMDIIVTVPWATASADTFWVATNGVLIDSTITGSTRTFRSKTRYPIASYLVTLSVAKFNRYYTSVNVNGVNTQVAYYLLRNTGSQASVITAMNKMNPILQAFSARFGDYPFKLEKHGFYDGLLGADGMEHQTFSGIKNTALTSLQTLTHELMHQWFGDNVTFATWNDLWLAEGFARYSEVLAAELFPSAGFSSSYSIRNGFKSAALGLNSNSAWIPNSSIGNSNQIWTSNYGSTVYERGCMVVSMLRALAGDAKFYEACTNYQTALAGKSATTDSLKNHFNRVLGVDISNFFNDYVGGSGPTPAPAGSNGVGNPVYAINWNTPIAKKLVLSVGGQTQTNAGVSYFNGPVVIHATNSAFPWTKDTTIVFYDWGGGNLSTAGNGLSAPIPGNQLSYNLSFTPTNIFIDDSARTLINAASSTVNKLATLAVDIVNFTAQKGAAGNQVHLQLAKNEPVNKVVLLKSANGTDFTEAGVMNNVNSNDQFLNFEFTDAIPYLPATFYRAKIYTTNGEEYSSTVKVQVAAKSKITITPSPANEKATVSFANPSKEQVAVRVVNAAGKTVLEMETKNNFIHIDVSNLSSGMYMLQVIKQDQVADTNKFLVRH